MGTKAKGFTPGTFDNLTEACRQGRQRFVGPAVQEFTAWLLMQGTRHARAEEHARRLVDADPQSSYHAAAAYHRAAQSLIADLIGKLPLRWDSAAWRDAVNAVAAVHGRAEGADDGPGRK